MHEGIDTRTVRPDVNAKLPLPEGRGTLTRDDPVVTYVARNLEPYRGFPNALLVDFFSAEALAQAVTDVLDRGSEAGQHPDLAPAPVVWLRGSWPPEEDCDASKPNRVGTISRGGAPPAFAVHKGPWQNHEVGKVFEGKSMPQPDLDFIARIPRTTRQRRVAGRPWVL